jgi:hypothetical protein
MLASSAQSTICLLTDIIGIPLTAACFTAIFTLLSVALDYFPIFKHASFISLAVGVF